jgi:outer membrane biosynthesis protein TonB
MTVSRAFLILSTSALLAACAAAPEKASLTGAVGFSEITTAAPTQARLALADNESFEPPVPYSGNALPAYPEHLLERRLPRQALCLRIGIGEDGRVVDAEPVREGPDCPGDLTEESAFFDAASHTVRTWRFDPAFRCVHPSAEAAQASQGGCGLGGTQEIPQAVSLVYRFVFRQIDGRGSGEFD